MLESVIFLMFAGVLLYSSVVVAVAHQTIHRALCLVLSFISAAALWILLQAEFLGLVLILVYVGAVLILFLFIIMTFSTTVLPSPQANWQYFSYYGLVLSVVLLGLGCLLYGLYDQSMYLPLRMPEHTTSSIIVQDSNTQALGTQLYTHYIYPFELVGMLLLTAVVVSISLHSHSQSPESVYKQPLSPRNQIRVKREHRIKLVKGE